MLLSGCAWLAPHQGYDAQQLKQHLPNAFTLNGVAFFPQKQLQCGPAALASAIVYQGLKVSPAELEPYLFVPARGGALQLELKAASRRYGLIAPNLEGGLRPLLATVAAGYPVVTLQNLGYEWLPQWHYAVVIGYDLEAGDLLLNSGTTEHYALALDTFLRTWQRADYWAVVPSQPDHPPPTIEAPELLREASALEQLGRFEAARRLYPLLRSKLPADPLVSFGIANCDYALGDKQAALQGFIGVTRDYPEFPWGWNNLAFALMGQGCRREALEAAACALSLAPDNPALHDTEAELLASESPHASECPTLAPCKPSEGSEPE